MSESWKNRLWSLLLVCTFAVVLSVCNKALDSSSDGSKSSSGGIAYADFKPSDINAVMFCNEYQMIGSIWIFYNCDDSSDSISMSPSDNYEVTLHTLVSNGFRPCASVGSGHVGRIGYFAFCKYDSVYNTFSCI